MSARTLPPSAREAAENELLGQLGLSPSASPEDVDQIHDAVSDYLAAAPAGIRGWAHAQAAALDAAYLQLTDPVGFEGSALRSPTRPPRVVPGGPATPPARRDALPAAPPPPADDLDDVEAEQEGDDYEALYASVTPSAHEDMGPDRNRSKGRKARRVATPVPVAPQPAGAAGWKKVAIGALGIALVVGIAFAGYALGGGGRPAGSDGSTAQASPTTPAVDEEKVAALMEKLQANPKDVTTLLALADEYYAGEVYDTAATFLDKVLAIDPKNVQALLARGAVDFNLGDLASAETTWKQVVAIAPNNQEVHYDLGFLYLNQKNPDWAGVQREWNKVIAIDATTDLASLVQQHLDSLAASSMLPASSPSASGTASPAASPATSPAASAAASPAVTPAGSAQP